MHDNLANDGLLLSIITLVLNGFITLSPQEIDVYTKAILGLFSIGTAIFAIRYYHIAYKEKKQTYKNNKNKE